MVRFLFKLALKLGRSVEELKATMPFKELVQWISFYELEPWGSEIEGIRHAVTAASSANAGLMMAAPKQLSKRPYKPKDFYVGVPSPDKVPVKVDIARKFHKLGESLKGASL